MRIAVFPCPAAKYAWTRAAMTAGVGDTPEAATAEEEEEEEEDDEA